MQLRSDIQLRTMINAMENLVLPAVDPANQLACEQAQLVTAMMHLMAHQLPLQFRFDCDELQRLITCAEKISSVCNQTAQLTALSKQLAHESTAAKNTLATAAIDSQTVTLAVRSLRELISSAITTASEIGVEIALAQELEKLVLAYSKEQLLRDRTLLIKQGWEADPEALPAIESLLGKS